MITLHVYWDDERHVFELPDGEHGVGRAACAVQLPDRRVSKEHAVLRVVGERLFVRDLGSRNGTLLDGNRVGVDEQEVPPQAEILFADTRAVRTSGAPPRGDEFLWDHTQLYEAQSYHPSDGYSDAAHQRIVKLLSGLFEFLGSRADPERIESEACEFVGRCVAADRVVLLEDSGPGAPLVPIARWAPGEPSNEPLRLSTRIADLVRQERRSVLIREPLTDPRLGDAKSVAELHLRSAMAAPLFDNERVRGVLYVDSRSELVHHGTDDLQVLTAIAHAVAVKLRNRSLEEGLRIAAGIQRTMLPAELGKVRGYEMAVLQEMCLAVGGDLYHSLPRPHDKQLIVVGDVSGKGMPAALAMSATMGFVRVLAGIVGSLEMLTAELHRQLWQTLQQQQFVTLFLGELDPTTGDLAYVNHGQERPLLVRSGGEIETLESTGMPVALFEELPVRTATTRLAAGDLLAVYSDGIPEATPNGADYFGIELLGEILARCRAEPLPSIVTQVRSAVSEFMLGGAASDDVTLLLVRRTAGDAAPDPEPS